MSSATIREPASFGKRKEPHQIIVVHKGKTRQFNISPIWASICAGTVFMFLFGYFAATAYLVFRDDLISSSFAKQARMQHEYEDRIASLRSKLDRITSRQLLDQQAIESQVRELMARQQIIGGRDGSMQELLDQARKRGFSPSPANVTPAGAVPVPSSRPDRNQRASLDDTITGSVARPQIAPSTGSLSLGYAAGGVNTDGAKAATAIEDAFMSDPLAASNSRYTKQLFGDVAAAISIIDTRQRAEIDSIRIAAAKKTERIREVLSKSGFKAPSISTDAVGGPFLPLDHTVEFDAHLSVLEDTLKAYDRVRSLARKLPFGNPLPGARITSRFGTRVDPFNGRAAMHSGIDFRAKTGTPVKSAGAGKVISAGRKGGYGKVVEVQHANGLTTRYAHLSRILVKPGQRVAKGKIIGKVGSTGRSTGPHLHYEVRRSNKKAINPAGFIHAGRKLNGLI